MGSAPLVAITVAFIGGLALGELFSYFPLTVALGLFLFLVLERRFKQGALLPVSLFLLGAAGLVVYQVAATPHSAEDLRRYVDQGEFRLIAQVDGPPQHAPQQVAFRMKAVALVDPPASDRPRAEGSDRVPSPAEGRPLQGAFRLIVYLPDAPFAYGDRLEMEIRLRRPQQFGTPGAFPYADYREREGWSGIASLSRLDRVRKIGEEGNRFLRWLYGCREEIRQKILASMEGEPAALLLALIIGETGYLTDPIREAFSASGTTHLLSISGSHLALVSLLIFGLTRWLLIRLPEPLLLRLSLRKIPSQWAALITAGPVFFYAFLAGAEVATLRSLVMISVYLFSIWIGRSGDLKVSLALAALLILIVNPQAIFDLSFQLSFLSVLAITSTFHWWKRTAPAETLIVPNAARSRRQRYLTDPLHLTVLSTLGATLGTAPLTLYYFHQFSWVGLLANMLLIPLAGWILVPFGLIAAVGSLFFEGGLPFAGPLQAAGSFYYQLTALFSRLPGADLHYAAPPLWGLVLFYAILFFMLHRPASRRAVGAVVAGFLIFFLGAGSFRFSPERLRVTMIDVGQGDSALIEFPHGKTILVDGGAGGTFDVGRLSVAPYLWERRIRTIDYLVGTHPQMDHIGGLASIVRGFGVGEVWSNGGSRDLPFFTLFSDALARKGLQAKVVTSESPAMSIDGCSLFFLNPPAQSPFSEEDFNNRSIVLRLACPELGGSGFSLLLTGDIEQRGEQRLLESGATLKSTVLKVPHHGSRSSLDRAFLSAVAPEVAVFSVGRHNSYRHPSPEVVAAYRELPAQVYRTDRDGAVVIEADPAGWRVKAYQDRKLAKIVWDSPLMIQEWENFRRALQAF